MPGIHVVFADKRAMDSIARIPASLLREPDYSVSTILDDDHLLCVLSGYPHYPVISSRIGDTSVVLEGIIYNMSDDDINLHLARIADSLADGEATANEVRQLVDMADGEFLVAMYSARLELLLVFNDRWGRLPAYVYSDDQRLVVSREVKFVIPWLPRVEFDPLGVADFLLFEFVPGDGTILKNVNALSHASLLRASIGAGRLEVTTSQTATECLDDPPAPMSRGSCCEQLRDLLLEATASRVNHLQAKGYTLTADLSGGFDSRLVCAALAEVGAPVSLYTDALVTGDESNYAQGVADILGLPLSRIAAPRESTSDGLAAITVATDCTVNAGSSLADHQDSKARLQVCSARTARFLGLGAGEFIKRVPRLKPGYRSVGQQMSAGHQVGLGSLKRVAALLAIPVPSLIDHIDSVLESYPERTNTGHLKRWHFEYERKLVTYGEDRSRSWIWPVAPLWSRGLYEFALTEIPERFGHGPSGLYFSLLQLMNPALAQAPVFSSNVVPHPQESHTRASMLQLAIDSVRYAGLHVAGVTWALETARRLTSRKSRSDTEVCTNLLSHLLHEPNLLWNVLDPSRAADTPAHMSAGHCWRLLTLAMYGAHLADGLAESHASAAESAP